ncbi:hypothetical protein FSARC_12679 [Fusarium sarcochroum]|uniref:Uncharacterized protein n=1 Tax=Fusarium sarcochroum TaxID=1208366 RepID=A0A8H4WWE8_9HYPO|nr:hypothetical protein FSARC_12679 [Fusarium sarcochroum]
MQPDTHTPPSDGDDSVRRPTHRLEAIQVGDNGVQLLVSTKDHLYDAKDVGAGAGAYQVIGSWEDSSVQELTKILSQRQVAANLQTTESTEATRFETTHGAGRSLPKAGSSNNNVRTISSQRVE